MRSSLIFEVSPRFSNRYHLCRMLASSARKMHRDGASTAQSINQSLKALRDTPAGVVPPRPDGAAQPPKNDAAGVIAGEETAGLR